MRVGILAILALTLSCIMVGCKGGEEAATPPAAADNSAAPSGKVGQGASVQAGLIPGGAPEKEAGSKGK